ncbi:P-loop ATPase, Sll1717 family [Methylorubrum sp. SB2]|uniref:P-loop ATPase, Sll1717 family n=1 Tax=Methylorubrum subtropicum TaxID=3138812 RepID=UPI00313EED3B
MAIRQAFFAYAGFPPDLAETIGAAAKLLEGNSDISVTIWPQMDIWGANIPDEVRAQIEQADALICDVTKPNLNVYYEAGYAIGLGKSIAPVINASFAGATADIQRDGFFDTIGYKTYENSQQLADILKSTTEVKLLDLYARPINSRQPIFVLDTYRKTDFRNSIVSAVKNNKVFYRSFDPVETPRFVSVSIIGDVTASAGVIIPVLLPHVDDAVRHNLRAAFLAGLVHGLGRESVLLRAEGQTEPAPTDYRNFIQTVRSENQIDDQVKDFAARAMLGLQGSSAKRTKKDRTGLQKLSLGASAAENEFRTLDNYFVETSEYLRTLRGEVSVVAGRKGSGKTAIFFMVRNAFREDRSCIVVDLKPESHQLSQFREELLKVVDAGGFDHTLASFWYFVIISEVLLAIKGGYDLKAKYDGKALSASRSIAGVLESFEVLESGDFTSRINKLGTLLLQEIARIKARKEQISPQKLTNIVFNEGIQKFRSLIAEHTTNRSNIIFLFDNIDKGWPANGVHSFDIRLVRLLKESLDKVGRDFHNADREFMSVVFLRNDIYELLVEATPDRQKAGQVRIDWTDRLKLRQVIFQRIQTTPNDKSLSFAELWSKYFVPEIDNLSSFDYLVDHCLMRPRFLINLIDYAIANAINRGHNQVLAEDLSDAVRQHANYLIDDFGYEIRDVSGLSEDILYALIGATQYLTRGEIIERLRKFSKTDDDAKNAFRLLLWYGIIGLADDAGREYFIYDYDYNIKRLEAQINSANGEALFVTNAAVHVALRSN